MAHTPQQTAAQRALSTPALDNRPQGIQPRKGGSRSEQGPLLSTAQNETPSHQEQSVPVPRTSRKRKHSIENTLGASPDSEPDRKQRRISPPRPTENTFGRHIDPVAFWAKEGHWPAEQDWPEETPGTGSTMDRYLARKRSSSSLSRKRSHSATSSITPSDQKPREEKSAPYKDVRYPLLLQTKGSYMSTSKLGVAETSKQLVRVLLSNEQSVPQGTLFDDDIFVDACCNLENRNEAKILQDISRLIVPSAESLSLRQKQYQRLVESVNEGWNNSIPLTKPRPQPDYSVGFRRDAFTADQLAKLSPFIGDFIAGDQSFFMATYYMYFPFLACEVKSGTAALDIADRQNAHSMTLAVRGVVELFCAVGREDEVNQKILAFSVSHDNRVVRIYGHYPVITGKDITYYRHPIHEFSFTALDGKDKWMAYRFTKNVYDIWMPKHFENICSAIDQLPMDLDFDVPALPSGSTGLSQDLGNMMQSGAFSSAGEGGSHPSTADQQAVTSGTLSSGLAKRRR